MRTIDEALEDLAGEKPEEQDTRLEDAWNVLVQVLLPLVLVLTFVIITSIHAYKRGYDVLLDLLGKDGRLAELENLELKADLQLEKLKRALEEVKAEQRQEIKLTLFPTAERVRRNGPRIKDNDFRLLCVYARDRLGDGSLLALSDYASRLYADVLRKAEVADPIGVEVRPWPAVEDVTENLDSTPGVTAANRRWIHNEILKFLSDLEREVADLQVALVDQIFKKILEKPGSTGNLDEEASRLLTRILDPAVPEEMRRRLAQELYRKILRHWQDQWDQDRYVFLERSWAKLRS